MYVHHYFKIILIVLHFLDMLFNLIHVNKEAHQLLSYKFDF